MDFFLVFFKKSPFSLTFGERSTINLSRFYAPRSRRCRRRRRQLESQIVAHGTDLNIHYEQNMLFIVFSFLLCHTVLSRVAATDDGRGTPCGVGDAERVRVALRA